LVEEYGKKRFFEHPKGCSGYPGREYRIRLSLASSVENKRTAGFGLYRIEVAGCDFPE
jgi:hypothetical protein